MIKVNLLKNRATGSSGGNTEFGDMTFDDNFEGAAGGFDLGAEPTDSKDIVVKVLVMLIWGVGLYSYELYNIGNLEAEHAKQQATYNTLHNEVAKKRPEVEKAKGLQAENNELNKKIELVKDLGKLRLREIRAIDHLQNIVPERVWFNIIEFKDNTFSVEGVSANDAELDKLLKGIRSYSTFQDVLLAKAVEEKSKQGTLKKFTITSNLAGGGAQ